MSDHLFAVCPHDTARAFEKWALLNTYVNKHLGLKSRFQLYLNFAEFGAALEQERFLWAYLNPADFLKARRRFGYLPVARARGRFDIAYVTGHCGSGAGQDTCVRPNQRLAAFNGYLYWLVKDRLAQAGVPFEHVPAKSYAEAMTLVERGQADRCVTYNEHFDGLSSSVRDQYFVCLTVDAGLSHVLAIHPSLGDEVRQALAQLLLGAVGTTDGQKILAELKMSGFEAVPEEPFMELSRILEAAT